MATEKRTIYKSRVYTYSCYAYELENGTVEFKQYYNNGETSTTKMFKSNEDFFNSLD